jgi:hypothetical protein
LEKVARLRGLRGGVAVGRVAHGIEVGARDVALGLDPFHKMVGTLTGAAPYREWAVRGITRRTVERGSAFGRAFHQAVERAHAIHFNVAGIEDVHEAFRLGAAGFGGRNYTNAEIRYVVQHEGLLNKTIWWHGDVRIPNPFR